MSKDNEPEADEPIHVEVNDRKTKIVAKPDSRLTTDMDIVNGAAFAPDGRKPKPAR
ncbi:MAG: hypothetical protein JO089_01055 [Alphaproteobacteria bacterium]|nr:hypothetical protein [Alphaproteobacteria bacterium]